jgi:hypothetical protein
MEVPSKKEGKSPAFIVFLTARRGALIYIYIYIYISGECSVIVVPRPTGQLERRADRGRGGRHTDIRYSITYGIECLCCRGVIELFTDVGVSKHVTFVPRG